jgi:ribonuclease P protein component
MRNGKRVRMEHLELRGLASCLHSVRVGVIVPKYRHSAVERNRLKRRLREVVRLQVLPRAKDLQLVVRTAPGAYDASLQELAVEIAEGLNQLSFAE